MRVEFMPQVTRLLENVETELTFDYLHYSWTTPTIAVRPPYYSHPVYKPYYPNL
ncbi:hypothetical protein SAMN02982927_03240 [Sporolactobacillus nakayamae]|uniref:Uncharacterized protein n=1 Tax=Sporolactobacillus nakayamae TaxID=269670 RepID=A0A1I2VT14_9BACL|nr:hypothetical protein SAMN02982927_03240 [Sporolactobacillus nakayamae]